MGWVEKETDEPAAAAAPPPAAEDPPEARVAAAAACCTAAEASSPLADPGRIAPVDRAWLGVCARALLFDTRH